MKTRSIAMLIALSLIAAVPASASGMVRQWTIDSGQVRALLPLENGDVALVISAPAYHTFTLRYVDAGGMERQQFQVPWRGLNEPPLQVVACGQTVHLIVQDDGVTRYVAWPLPLDSVTGQPVFCSQRFDVPGGSLKIYPPQNMTR